MLHADGARSLLSRATARLRKSAPKRRRQNEALQKAIASVSSSSSSRPLIARPARAEKKLAAEKTVFVPVSVLSSSARACELDTFRAKLQPRRRAQAFQG